jgi:hypothetical protein
MTIPSTKTAFGATAGADSGLGNYLNKPLRRLQWLRQELDLWNESEGARPMPQSKDFGLTLPDLKPSEAHWRLAA